MDVKSRKFKSWPVDVYFDGTQLLQPLDSLLLNIAVLQFVFKIDGSALIKSSAYVWSYFYIAFTKVNSKVDFPIGTTSYHSYKLIFAFYLVI